MLKKGDLITRNKYNNDIVFIVNDIKNNKVYLSGLDVRLYADADINDIKVINKYKKKDQILKINNLERNDYFYLIPNVLHIDSDKNYLDRCIEFYKENGVKAVGYLSSEEKYEDIIKNLIEKYSPNIIVLTGHDAYYKNKKDNKQYKNSEYFVNTIKKIRKIDSNIIIYAGACQSDFESLIIAGASYASSPKRVNIHALDPAIVATFIALTENTKYVDTKQCANLTHYKSDGIGGINIRGRMFKGYPRKENT